METQSFSLDLAKQGKKVITKCGFPVRIICFDRKDPVRPIVALVTMPDGREETYYYPPNGRNIDNDNYTLVHSYEERELYVVCPFRCGLLVTSEGISYRNYDDAAKAAELKKEGIWVIVKQTWKE